MKRESTFEKWFKILLNLTVFGAVYALLLSFIFKANISIFRGIMIVILINLTVSTVKTASKEWSKANE